jgi:hypothetical protein
MGAGEGVALTHKLQNNSLSPQLKDNEIWRSLPLLRSAIFQHAVTEHMRMAKRRYHCCYTVEKHFRTQEKQETLNNLIFECVFKIYYKMIIIN